MRRLQLRHIGHICSANDFMKILKLFNNSSQSQTTIFKLYFVPKIILPGMSPISEKSPEDIRDNYYSSV